MLTKPTLNELLDTTRRTIEPVMNHHITKDVLDYPVSLNTFYKRDKDYLLITKIVSTHYSPSRDKVISVVEGHVLTTEQYRHLTISKLLNE